MNLNHKMVKKTDDASKDLVVIEKIKLKLNTVYSFNIAPSDSYQGLCKTKSSLADPERETICYKHMRKFLQEFSVRDVDYYLQTELSEPIEGYKDKLFSRLHYHGYIMFPTVDSLKWFLLYGTPLLAHICTYSLGHISNKRIWYEYVHKQEFLGLKKIKTLYFENKDNILPKE